MDTCLFNVLRQRVLPNNLAGESLQNKHPLPRGFEHWFESPNPYAKTIPMDLLCLLGGADTGLGGGCCIEGEFYDISS
eukprot:288991-Amphidinium_carterae.1